MSVADGASTEIQIYACSDWDDEDEWDCSSTSVLSPDASAFSIEGLDPGDYRLRFWAAGYETAYREVTVVENQLSPLSSVTLTKLDPGTLGGTVAGTDGAVMSGVTVTASTQGVGDLTATTDTEGHYSFSDMPSGIWWNLTFSKEGYAPVSDGAMVDPGQHVAMGTTHLALAGSVSVHVQTTTAAALSGAELRLCDSDENTCVWGSEDSGGDYTFSGVTPGVYFLHASADGYVEGFYPGVRNIANATPIRVSEEGSVSLETPFTMVRPASLAGTVTFGDSTAASSEIGLYDSTGVEIDSSEVYGSGSGAYEFSDLWPGSYTVKATSEQGFGTVWLGGSSTYAGATQVTLAEASAATGNNITFAGDVVVTGTLTDAEGPLDSAEITLASVDDDGETGYAISNSDGTYSLRLPAGSYNVTINAAGSTVCGWNYTTKCVTGPVTVSASSTLHNFQLPTGSGGVGGSVTVAEDITDFSIELRDASDSQIAQDSWYRDGGEPPWDNYYFHRVPNGHYTLVVSGWVADQRRGVAKEYPITIDGQSVVQDVTIAAAHSISGALTTAQSERWIEVEAINIDTGFIQYVSLDGMAAGTFNYSLPVPPGSYKVLARTPTSDLWYPGVSTMSASQTVTVGEGSDSTGIDFTLAQTRFTVTGKLVLPEGVTTAQAQQNLRIWFADAAVTSDNTNLDTYDATIDGSGNYSVSLPAGTYRAHVKASPELGTTAGVGDSFSVTTTQSGPDISLAKGGSVEGRVLATDGVAVASAEVTVTGADGVSAETYADSLGYWQLDGVAAGPATVKALATGYVSGTADPSPTVAVGTSVTVATIRLAPAGRLYVGLPDESFDVVDVVVTDTAGNTLRESAVWGGDAPRVIDNVPVGAVKVRFEGDEIATEWWKDADSLNAATPITLNATTAVTLLPSLAAPSSGEVQTGTLSGTVTNVSGVSGKLWVSAEPEVGFGYYEAVLDSEGAYQIVAPPGSYTVTAFLCTGYWSGGDYVSCEGGYRSLVWEGSAQVTADHTTSGINFTFAAEEFTSTPAPTITGASAGGAQVGDELSAGVSGWSPSPDSFSYQWLRDGTNISGATSASYILTEADRGADISVKVTAVRAGYQSVTQTSDTLAGPARVNFTTTPVPTITGDAKLDATLTAHAGTWEPEADQLVYTWFADSTQIAQGQDLTTYTLTEAEVGKTITVKVTASKASYEPVTTESAATSTVTAETLASTKPTITGTATFGQELTAVAGTWTDGATLAYQWYRGADKIQGATQTTYTLGATDVGKAITVTVTGTKTGYLPHSETSLATDTVAALTMTSAKPQITGEAKVGVQLTATVTGWNPADADFSYAWSADDVAIAGATASTFTPTAAQLGKAITVTVTATKSGYESTSSASDPTAAVAAAQILGPTPRVSGTAKVGYRLTATAGTWTPSGVSLSYQWYASGAAISRATGSSLLLTPAQRGKRITVKVTGSYGGSVVARVSAATAAVAPGTLSAKTPAISGTAKVGKKLKAKSAAWGPSPVTLRYQWYANGKKISKATASSYKIAKKYKGKKITVTVTGSKAGYTTVAKKSKATKRVK